MKWIVKAIIILTLSYSKIIACAGGWAELYVKDEYYNFLNATMVNLHEDNPLYQLSNNYSAHNQRFDYFDNIQKESNIQAWKAYFHNTLSNHEIETLFYGENAITKSAKAYKISTKYPQFGIYLNYLAQQMTYVQKEKASNSDYNDIINKGLALLNKESDVFLKERYLFLVMRRYHHHAEYQKALNLYNEYYDSIQKNGIVSEWIDALRAGSYQHLKESTKANQLYAKIFQNNKTNAHFGYYDFKIHSDKEWKTLLDSAKTPDEQALYYFLRAMNWKNEPLLELESIAKIAPKSIWFERLSYMLMQDFQNQRYMLMSQGKNKNKYFKAQEKSYILQKNHFIKILTSLKEPTFFNLYSQLYLETLEQKPLKISAIKQLKTLSKDKDILYIDLLVYMNTLHQLKKLENTTQENLFTQLKSFLSKLPSNQQSSLLRYTALQMATLYDEKSIERKFHQLFAKNKELYRYLILETINFEDAKTFEAYVEKKERSFLEAKVFKAQMTPLHKNDIANILSTLYMQENDFTKVAYYLRQIPGNHTTSPYNPFNSTLSGNNRTPSKGGYNERKFVETMLRIKDKINKNSTDAMDYYLYATGLYNKSWFGNFPMSAVLYRNTSSLPKNKKTTILALNEAQSYYEQAYTYTKEPEFRAKIAYQILKVQFNKVFIQEYGNEWLPIFGEWNGTEKIIKQLKSSKAFSTAIKDFKSEYAQTEYAKEIIRNCITFQYF